MLPLSLFTGEGSQDQPEVIWSGQPRAQILSGDAARDWAREGDVPGASLTAVALRGPRRDGVCRHCRHPRPDLYDVKLAFLARNEASGPASTHDVAEQRSAPVASNPAPV